MKVLLDTDILSLFLRGDPNVVTRFRAYLNEHDQISFSIITYYEILSGLRHRDARKQMEAFLKLTAASEVIPLTMQSIDHSARLYADLRRTGQPLDDIDLLIAGVALAGDMALATRNTDHFERIEDLTIQNWSEAAQD